MELIAKCFCVSVSALLLTACSYLPQVPLKLNVAAARSINPSAYHKPLPVLIKVYSLSSEQAFINASFQQIWQDDAATLGDSLVNQQEFMLAPDEKSRITLPRGRGATFIAVAAIFRDAKHGQWRVVKKLPQPVIAWFKPITVFVHDNVVALG